MTPPPKEHPMDWNAKLVRFFLHNSRLVWLLLIGTILGGFFAITNLRREGFPQVSPNVVVVQTVYPGATAAEVEQDVTSVIESAVKDVKHLKQTSSTSGNSFSNVAITLDESANLETAIQDIQSKVQAARGDLPNDIEPPHVQTFSTGGSAFILGVTDADVELGVTRVDAQTVMRALDDVDGIKSVKLFTEATDKIYIQFDSTKLATNNISLSTLQQVLQANNVSFPLGSVTDGQKTAAVMTAGSFENFDQIKKLIVGVQPQTGLPVALSDVATIQRATDDNQAINRFAYRTHGKLESHAGILLSVDVTATADVIRVKQAMLDQLAQKHLDGTIPNHTSIILLNDQAKSTQSQIDEIVGGALGTKSNWYLLGGIQLLFLAMLAFVNWRAALISALAIPISLLFTFLCLSLFGIQLNTIVLFSLILVLGLIVDPAIVMVEAIQRYRDLKYGKEEAILESGRRYGASLFMAVLTSVIVFVPFGVVSGIFGQIIKYIPLTVIPALFASYLIPIGFLPLFTKFLLQTHKPASHADGKAHEVEGLSPAAEWFMSVNRVLLARRWRQIVALLVAILLVAASASLIAFGKVQTVQFSKAKDNPNISISATLPPGTPDGARDVIGKQLENLLAKESGVENFFYFGQNKTSLFLWAELADKKDRSEENSSKNIVERLRKDVRQISGMSDVIVTEVGTGTPEADFQISTQLYDNDPVVLEAAAKDVGAFLAKQAKVVKVDDGFTDRGTPQVQVVLNRSKVQAAGLSSFEIGQQLKALTDELKVTKYTGLGGDADIYLVRSATNQSLQDVNNLPLISRSGQAFRVQDVATITTGTAVDAIQRFNGQRFVNVKARVDGNNSDVFVVQRALNDYLTADTLKRLHIDSNESRGEFDDIAKSFRELGIALGLAIFLTYIVLVLQFKSFSQPFIMIVTVPLSFIGVFPALWLTGSDLGFLELLGITILVGIVENVGIFLIDYANQLQSERGLSPREAMIQAVGVRFRPILLTKLVALGGLLPLAIESDFWRGLAVTIIAGIGLSGFLSLIVVPILYVWIEGSRKKIHRHAA